MKINIHPFPARMAPEIALEAMSRMKKGSVICDPMAGSGTVLLAAAKNGLNTFGFDMDPLAIMISTAACASVQSEAVIENALKIVRSFRSLDRRTLPRYHPCMDQETRRFVDYWFSTKNQRAICFIAMKISSLSDLTMRSVLSTALSATIIVKRNGASRARDVAHSRPHIDHEYQDRNVEDLFLNRVYGNVARFLAARGPLGATPEICLGDARRLPLQARSVDMIVTSPPYLNAIDYMRGHRLSLVWFGHTLQHLREIRATSLGSERALYTNDTPKSSRRNGIAARFAHDLSTVLFEYRRVLRPSGSLICVIGDNVWENGGSDNAKLLITAALEADFRFVSSAQREIPKNRRYLPPPNIDVKSPLSARLSIESVLQFSCSR